MTEDGIDRFYYCCGKCHTLLSDPGQFVQHKQTCFGAKVLDGAPRLYAYPSSCLVKFLTCCSVCNHKDNCPFVGKEVSTAKQLVDSLSHAGVPDGEAETPTPSSSKQKDPEQLSKGSNGAEVHSGEKLAECRANQEKTNKCKSTAQSNKSSAACPGQRQPRKGKGLVSQATKQPSGSTLRQEKSNEEVSRPPTPKQQLKASSQKDQAGEGTFTTPSRKKQSEQQLIRSPPYKEQSVTKPNNPKILKAEIIHEPGKKPMLKMQLLINPPQPSLQDDTSGKQPQTLPESQDEEPPSVDHEKSDQQPSEKSKKYSLRLIKQSPHPKKSGQLSIKSLPKGQKSSELRQLNQPKDQSKQTRQPPLCRAKSVSPPASLAGLKPHIVEQARKLPSLQVNLIRLPSQYTPKQSKPSKQIDQSTASQQQLLLTSTTTPATNQPEKQHPQLSSSTDITRGRSLRGAQKRTFGKKQSPIEREQSEKKTSQPCSTTRKNKGKGKTSCQAFPEKEMLDVHVSELSTKQSPPKKRPLEVSSDKGESEEAQALPKTPVKRVSERNKRKTFHSESEDEPSSPPPSPALSSGSSYQPSPPSSPFSSDEDISGAPSTWSSPNMEESGKISSGLPQMHGHLDSQHSQSSLKKGLENQESGHSSASKGKPDQTRQLGNLSSLFSLPKNPSMQIKQPTTQHGQVGQQPVQPGVLQGGQMSVQPPQLQAQLVQLPGQPPTIQLRYVQPPGLPTLQQQGQAFQTPAVRPPFVQQPMQLTHQQGQAPLQPVSYALVNGQIVAQYVQPSPVLGQSPQQPTPYILQDGKLVPNPLQLPLLQGQGVQQPVTYALQNGKLVAQTTVQNAQSFQAKAGAGIPAQQDVQPSSSQGQIPSQPVLYMLENGKLVPRPVQTTSSDVPQQHFTYALQNGKLVAQTLTKTDESSPGQGKAENSPPQNSQPTEAQGLTAQVQGQDNTTAAKAVEPSSSSQETEKSGSPCVESSPDVAQVEDPSLQAHHTTSEQGERSAPEVNTEKGKPSEQESTEGSAEQGHDKKSALETPLIIAEKAQGEKSVPAFVKTSTEQGASKNAMPETSQDSADKGQKSVTETSQDSADKEQGTASVTKTSQDSADIEQGTASVTETSQDSADKEQRTASVTETKQDSAEKGKGDKPEPQTTQPTTVQAGIALPTVPQPAQPPPGQSLTYSLQNGQLSSQPITYTLQNGQLVQQPVVFYQPTLYPGSFLLPKLNNMISYGPMGPLGAAGMTQLLHTLQNSNTNSQSPSKPSSEKKSTPKKDKETTPKVKKEKTEGPTGNKRKTNTSGTLEKKRKVDSNGNPESQADDPEHSDGFVDDDAETGDVLPDKLKSNITFDHPYDSKSNTSTKKRKRKRYPKPKEEGPFNYEDCRRILKLNECDSVILYYLCDVCLWKTTEKEQFIAHRDAHTAAKGTEKLEFTCEHCSLIFNDKGKRNSHMKIHGGKPFRCPICLKMYTSRASLRHHDRKDHHITDEKVTCPFEGCGQELANSCRLQMHLLKHNSKYQRVPGRYKCPHCPHRTTDKSTMNRHLLVHTGEKKFKCAKCKYQAYTKAEIRRHLVIHTGEQRYACDRCSYATPYSGALKHHVMKHLGIRPWQCVICGFCDDSRCKALLHVRRKHKTLVPANPNDAVLRLGVKLDINTEDYRIKKPLREVLASLESTEDRVAAKCLPNEELSAGQPTEGELTQGQPTEGQLMEGQPTEGQATQGQFKQEQLPSELNVNTVNIPDEVHVEKVEAFPGGNIFVPNNENLPEGEPPSLKVEPITTLVISESHDEILEEIMDVGAEMYICEEIISC